MDIQLQNAYVEVLLDNFMSVVKQNIMFQAQLEVMKKTLNELNAKQDNVELLQSQNAELEKQLQLLTSENVVLKNDVNSRVAPETLRNEKSRLQSAVNDYMRQVKTLQSELMEVRAESQEVLIKNNNHIEELNKYINRLESVVPANKLKKVKLGEISPIVEEPSNEIPVSTIEQVLTFGETGSQSEQPESTEDNIKSGGSF